MSAYYNEFDPFAAEWLRQLIAAEVIAAGDVDTRSVEDVTPNDLRGYTQCHFFAGIGVWSYALRQAGWPDDRPVWTGSCPCQPFSAAGKGAGFADERHLWPAFFHLIEQCRPAIVFGEQVASKAVEPWIDLVQTDLEAVGYAFGCVPFPASSVGAPHIRDRAYWVADSKSERQQQFKSATRKGSGVFSQENEQEERLQSISGHGPSSLRLADNSGEGLEKRIRESGLRGENLPIERCGESCKRPGPTNGFWRDADWLFCRDGKWRPTQPKIFPLAHGVANRVGLLRGAGNAINAEAAKIFIQAFIEIQGANQ